MVLAALPRPAAVDEFQRAGRGFLLAVKQAADLDSARGQLLLTGSANYLADRTISETLAGRAGRLVLWPLSVGERHGVRETFLDHLFQPDSWPPPVTATPSRSELVAWILEGGFPEIVTQGMPVRQRRAWFDAYVSDVVSREALRPLAEIRLETELRVVLRLLAARTAGELVMSEVASDVQLARETTADYIGLLEALYLVVRLPGWSTNHTTRAKRRPKVLLVDSGLAAGPHHLRPPDRPVRRRRSQTHRHPGRTARQDPRGIPGSLRTTLHPRTGGTRWRAHPATR